MRHWCNLGYTSLWILTSHHRGFDSTIKPLPLRTLFAWVCKKRVRWSRPRWSTSPTIPSKSRAWAWNQQGVLVLNGFSTAHTLPLADAYIMMGTHYGAYVIEGNPIWWTDILGLWVPIHLPQLRAYARCMATWYGVSRVWRTDALGMETILTHASSSLLSEPIFPHMYRSESYP